MAQSSRMGGSIAQRQFLPATQSLTMGLFASAWKDISKAKERCRHTWLDLCDELSYALAFYQEWQRRHRF